MSQRSAPRFMHARHEGDAPAPQPTTAPQEWTRYTVVAIAEVLRKMLVRPQKASDCWRVLEETLPGVSRPQIRDAGTSVGMVYERDSRGSWTWRLPSEEEL